MINASAPLSPAQWLQPPPGTSAGALPLGGEGFSVVGNPEAVMLPYFVIDAQRFTVFPIVR